MKNLILVHLESVSELIINTNQDLFPNINNILQESTYYKNYFSSATSTLMVISDLCYGGMYRERCLKLENNFHDLGNYSSLFDELKNKGYSVKGVIWPEITTYSKIINGNIIGKNMEIISADNYVDFINNIDEFIDREERFALFIANFISHISYRTNKELKGNSYARWKEGYQLIDDTCGKVIELLKRRGKNNDTIVMFYGDHGDDYWGHRLHNGYTHAIEPYSCLIHVPLIVRDISRKKNIDYTLMSTLDIKSMIKNILSNQVYENDRKYVFSRNIYANQKIDVMSLSKGYAVIAEGYILLASIRGLELYNINMDPANTCNLLEFFNMDKKGNITFNLKFKKVRSMHLREFFSDREIRHIKSVYGQLKYILLHETEKIYSDIGKEVKTRDKEINFYKINRYHFYHMYNSNLINKIEKGLFQIDVPNWLKIK